MKNKLNKGFTLIELLVVIAIIGILASVVLASLNSARTKGKDASAKTSMTSVRDQAEIYYNGGGNYHYVNNSNSTTVCADPQISKLLNAAMTQTGATLTVCQNSADTYAADVVLGDGSTHFCVDSTGFAGEGKTAQSDINNDASCQ